MALKYVDPDKPRGRLYRAICSFSATRAGLWISRRVSWRLDPILLRFTNGRIRSTGPLAAALLETRGARTGEWRRHATLYFHDGDRITIVASKAGWPSHPAWYHNLRKNPDVLYGGEPFRAHVIEDEDERRRLWQLADRVFPPFETYRRRAAEVGRTIPIVQLIPHSPGGSASAGG
jgi:deazaflavin-dependent oxidoreductase (nitroreductase family)